MLVLANFELKIFWNASIQDFRYANVACENAVNYARNQLRRISSKFELVQVGLAKFPMRLRFCYLNLQWFTQYLGRTMMQQGKVNGWSVKLLEQIVAADPNKQLSPPRATVAQPYFSPCNCSAYFKRWDPVPRRLSL